MTVSSFSTPTPRFLTFARDIKLSHSIFAMPWALLATFVAARDWPLPGQLLLVVLCMVTARTVAMSSNRLLDARIDAWNPRTARRAIPSGQLSKTFFVTTLAACGLAFIAATSLFGFIYSNWLPLILSLPVLFFIALYPLLKRFTRLCHYYLGAALALAPVCAWIAIAGRVDPPPLLMAAAVLLWTAGFDIIYACQDYEIDCATGLFSVPSQIGIANALWTARLTHLGALAFMITLARFVESFGAIWLVALALAAVLLVIEHALVRADDLSKVGLAFFTVNGMISVVIGALGIIDVLV